MVLVMVNRIKQWLYGIKADKLLHFIAGLLVAEGVAGALSHFARLYALIVGLAASVVVGYLKERWDSKHGGVVSDKDFVATVIGGSVGTIVTLISLL